MCFCFRMGAGRVPLDGFNEKVAEERGEEEGEEQGEKYDDKVGSQQ